MGKYRKKPIVVEAFQWGGQPHPCVLYPNGEPVVYDYLHASYGRIEVGDWIITGPQGEHYPIKADVFAATYEALAPDSAPEGGR